VMKKIKKIAYGISATAMLLPAIAFGLEDSSSPSGWSEEFVTGTGLSTASVYEVIRTLLNWLLGIIGVLALVGFVISGIMYITAAGDEDRVDKAKAMLTYSIIGIVVALVGLIIVQALSYIIGGGEITAKP